MTAKCSAIIIRQHGMVIIFDHSHSFNIIDIYAGYVAKCHHSRLNLDYFRTAGDALREEKMYMKYWIFDFSNFSATG